MVKKVRQYTATKLVLFVFSFMEARGSFSPFYSALKLISPKVLPRKDHFYSYYHKLLNMHKLLILFNISNTNCIKVSNITLGKYTLHICNIINLTVCEKKKLLESKIRLKFHFNKSHGNVRLSTLVGFLSQCFFYIFNWVWALQHWSGTRFHIHLVLLRSWRNLQKQKKKKL